jgi:release factor glutamine methyltransferase
MNNQVNKRLDAVLANAAARLGEVSDSSRLDAEILLARTIDMPRSYLFAHPEDELDEHTIERFCALLERRAVGEPMAYLMGTKEFWSRELIVNASTLVPRPETEVLVDLALREIPRKAAWRILDLGTGSGAIAIALASERMLCQITATDISADALAVAQENARHLCLGNVDFAQGSWTEPVRERRFEVIVSNPPYVRADDTALRKLSHEPVSALVAGTDGLDAIRILAEDCGEILEEDGVLLVEHGAEQRADVAAIFRASGWTDIVGHDDYAGLPRVTVARRGGK